MAIDIQTISQLRDKTGAGIGDCKKALEEAVGDIDKAIEVLRKRGEIKAAKKSDRATTEGIVAIKKENSKTAVTALACETDFVSRNEDFIIVAESLPGKLLALGETGFKTWAENYIKNELIIKIGENIQLADFGIIEGEIIGTYIHSNKKIAAVVVLSGGEELANDIAMQVVAMTPKYLKPEDVTVDELEKEKEIYRVQLQQENKPANIWDKIIEGKLNKYYEEVCLLNQSFIKDEDKKISDLIKEAGSDVEIKSFRRFQV